MWARGLPNSLASLSLDFTANTWAHNLPLFFSSSRRPRLTKTVVLAWWPATASLWFSRSVPPSKHHIFKKVLASPFGRPWPSPTFKRLQSRYQQSCMTENCWEIWGRRIWGRQAFLNFRRPVQVDANRNHAQDSGCRGYLEGFWRNFACIRVFWTFLQFYHYRGRCWVIRGEIPCTIVVSKQQNLKLMTSYVHTIFYILPLDD